MNGPYMARLKKASASVNLSPATPVPESSTGGFVGFVAPVRACIEKSNSVQQPASGGGFVGFEASPLMSFIQQHRSDKSVPDVTEAFSASLIRKYTPANSGATKPTKPVLLGEMGDYDLRADPVDPESVGKPFGWKGSIFAGLGFVEAAAKPVHSMTPKMLAASQAQDASVAAVGPNAAPDPDRHCWPHSTAMTGAEIDTFTARLSRITDKGVSLNDGEAMADKLLIRDRQAGDWFSCLECAHLGGYGSSSWRCGNWKAAGVALRAKDALLPADLVQQLQHCDGFKAGSS